MGDLDGNGTPEIVFAGAGAMHALTYDETSNGTGYKNMRIMHKHTPFAETAGFTVFDFNQDGKMEIVYRGSSLGFYIVDGTTLSNLTAPITCYSGTVAEYPIVADVDGDGHADIVIVDNNVVWNGTNAIGFLRVYESQTARTWAPAKTTWNSWGYTPVSINDDLTVPKYQVNPATKLSSGKNPYNLFLAQTTTINQEGDLLFQTPNPSPGLMNYVYNPSTDILTVNVNVINKGEADLGPIIYASLYDGVYTSSDYITTGSVLATVSPGDSTTVTITVNTASNYFPMDSLAVRINDDGTNHPFQAECDSTDNTIKSSIVLYQVTYDGNTSDGGTIPTDNKFYNANDGVKIMPAGSMSLTDATFIGWTFTTPAPGIITTASAVPGDLMQPDSIFPNLVSDTTFYAVWAEDKRGTGGGPDSVPDYLQKEVFYDRTLATSGTAPVDNNLYNPNDSVGVKGNEGGMSLTDATFIGWSFTNQTDTVKTVAGIPSDLIQPADSFEILQTDTTLYAVWAIDKTGPGGVPDSIPDYLQFEVIYNKSLATIGNVPVDGNLYNASDSVTVKGNEGSPQLALPDATFIGWSFVDQTDTVKTITDIPSDLIQPADSFEIMSDTTLYAVWAIDKTGPGGIPDSVPDYLQFEVIYQNTLTATGIPPVDGNLYNASDSVTVKANEGIPPMALTDATFIGWSFTNQTDTINTAAGVPSDLIQPADSFEILRDTILYAVWAIDKTGPGGIPDSIPDYLQTGVVYNKTLAQSGVAPVDGNLYNNGDSVTVKGNEGVPPMAHSTGCFIGWSFTNQTALITTAASIPSDLIQPADSFELMSPVVLYATWAEDNTGPNGVPDSIPDYLQFEVIYNKSLATIGNVPVDGNLYNASDSVTVKGNEGSPQLTLPDATFIGWSFVDQTDTVKTVTDIPVDLIQPADSFEIISDTTLYAVWAIDKTGPNGIPDSIPDYLQYEVLYNKTLALTGIVPVDGNLYNDNDSVTVKGNEGTLALPDATFIGWSFVDQTSVVTTASGIPSDLIQPADSFEIISDTTLYAVWAEDKRGTGGGPDSVPDYLQFEVFYNPDIATGNAPIDNNLYNSLDSVKVKGNEGSPQMSLTDACFMGWSFSAPGAIITTVAGIPSDLIQPADSFEIQSDTILYAVWGEDKTGPGGVPDSIPDFGQASVTYNKTLATAGAEPVDGNLYNISNSVTVKGNEGAMMLDSACFIGWSFVDQTSIITTAAAVPADRINPSQTFTILGDTILYAIWAEDKTGPGGIPDSIPDYLQFEVIYNGNTNTGGVVPVDGNLYNNGNTVVLYGNTGILEKTNTCFIGWSGVQKPVVTVIGDVPADLKQGGNVFTITSDTTFYAVWAEDNSGPNGVPDSIPDYLQFPVTYNGNGHTGGSVPVDINLYNNGDQVTILGNTGILEKANACFIGWSYSAHSLVTTTVAVPADLSQGGDVFNITAATTFYAVWAEDTNGPDGVPDSVPDYLQVTLTYHQNTTYPDNYCLGTVPTPNPTMHTMNTSVVIKGNTGGLCRQPSESVIFAGWSASDNWIFVEYAWQKPSDMLMAGDVMPVGTSDIDLYVVWAYDRNGNGIPDFNEPSVAVVPDHTWPETEDQGNPGDPGYYPTKPDWKPEYDDSGKNTLYAGCEMSFIVTVDPDPYRDRTFKINYLGALTEDLIVGSDGKKLADSYTLPKNQSTYTIKFSLNDIPAELEGQQGALEAEIIGGGRDTSAWMTLYNHPTYDLILVKPILDANNKIDLGITGGSPNLMRSINGLTWRNAYSPLTAAEQMSMADGVSIWLREPNGCWEAQFFFMTYIDPEIQRYVEIPNSVEVTTDPGSGKHYVKGHKDFTFTASYAGGSPLKVMAQGFYSGTYKELIGQDMEDGTYQYVIRQVVEPWTITFGPDPASGITAEEYIDGISVWAHKNTLYIRSDITTRVYIYSMSGSLYKYLDIHEGDTRDILNRGVYVVVIGEKRYKVIIK